SHDDVAAQDHFEAAAERVAVDARDDRDVERGANRNAAEPAGPRLRPVIEAFLAGALDVRAGAERPVAGARQHGNTDFAILLELQPDLAQPRLARIVDGVEHVGPVDRDPGHVILNLAADAHAVTPRRAPANSARISSVCSPSRGGGRRACTSAADMWIGEPMRRS